MSELERYLEEVLIESQGEAEEIEKLYRQFFMLSSSTVQESTYKEDAPLNNNIVNKLRPLYCIDMHNANKSLIVKLKSNKGLLQIDEMITNIRNNLDHMLIRRSNEKLITLVLDFCEDENRTFFFTKIKNFTVKTVPFPIEISESEEEFVCPGKYCYQENQEEKDKTNVGKPKFYKMLRKNLIEDNKPPSFTIATSVYNYQTVEVCANCFEVYMKKERMKIKNEMKTEKKPEIDVYKYRFSKPIGELKALNMSSKFRKEKSFANLSRANSSFFMHSKQDIVDFLLED
jgi:hypothetical protein